MFLLNFSISPFSSFTTQQLYGPGQYVPSPFSISSVPMAYRGNGNDFAAQNPFWSSNSLGVQNELSSMGLFPRRSSMSIDDMVGIMVGRSSLPGFNSFNTFSPLNSMLSLMDGGTSTSFIQPSSPTILDMARSLMDGGPFIFNSNFNTLNTNGNFITPTPSFNSFSNGFSPLDIFRSVMYSGSGSGMSTNFATSRVASQFFPVIEAVSTGSILNSPLTTA